MNTTSTLNQLRKGSWIPVKAMAFTAFCCSLGAVSAQTSVLLPVAHDVSLGYHDNYNSENTNYNSSIHYSAFSQPGAMGGINKGRGLMDFDLAVIPAGSDILGAFLNLTALGPFGTGTVGTVGSTGQNTCTLRRVTSYWNDATVTWNTPPSNTMENAVALAQSTYAMQNYYSVDVTALVQDMVADPSNSFGFMIVLDDETPSRGLVFHSGMAQYPDQRPTLLVVYGSCGAAGMQETNNARGGLVVTPSIASAGEHMVLNMPGAVEQPEHLEVLDAAGRMVWNTRATQWPVQWKVPALAQGAYTLVAKDRTGQVLGTARAVIR